MKHPKIFDTTLRDGEQMPSVVFNLDEKIELARKFDEFGINYIDVMPVISENEKKFVENLMNENLRAEITASCRAKKEDVDISIGCGVKKVTVFSPVSDLNIKYMLKTDREGNLKKTLETIDYAKSFGLKVDLAAVDASRADKEYLDEIVEEISKNVETLYIADTVGCLTPPQSFNLIESVKDHCYSLVGLHMHNDFGLATANTLAGLEAGADIFSGTFNGIGPSAGNAPLEEVCMGLKHIYGLDLDLKYEMIGEICDLVEHYSKVKLQKHKPICGEYATAHEAGIHVASVIENPSTFEAFDPQSIGRKRKILIGKKSGKKAIEYVLQKNGKSLSGYDKDQLLRNIKSFSEYKKRPLSEKEVVKVYEENTHPLPFV